MDPMTSNQLTVWTRYSDLSGINTEEADPQSILTTDTTDAMRSESFFPETEVTNLETTYNEAGKPIKPSDAIISIIQRKLDAIKYNNEDNRLMVNLLDFPETNDKDIRFLFHIAKKQNLIVTLKISSMHITEIPASDYLENLVMNNCYRIHSLPVLNNLKHLKIGNSREKVSIKWPKSLPELTCCVLSNINVENFPKDLPNVKYLKLQPATDPFSSLPEDLIVNIFSFLPNNIKEPFGSCSKKIRTPLFEKPPEPLYHFLIEKKWKILNREFSLPSNMKFHYSFEPLQSITASDEIFRIINRKLDAIKHNNEDNKLTINLLDFPETNDENIRVLFYVAKTLNLVVASLKISSMDITELPVSDLETLVMYNCYGIRSLPVLNNLKYLKIEYSKLGFSKRGCIEWPDESFSELTCCQLRNVEIKNFPIELPSLKYLKLSAIVLQCQSNLRFGKDQESLDLNLLLKLAPNLTRLLIKIPNIREHYFGGHTFSITHPTLKDLSLYDFFVSNLKFNLKTPNLQALKIKECGTLTSMEDSELPALNSLTIKWCDLLQPHTLNIDVSKLESCVIEDCKQFSKEDNSTLCDEKYSRALPGPCVIQ